MKILQLKTYNAAFYKFDIVGIQILALSRYLNGPKPLAIQSSNGNLNGARKIDWNLEGIRIVAILDAAF